MKEWEKESEPQKTATAASNKGTDNPLQNSLLGNMSPDFQNKVMQVSANALQQAKNGTSQNPEPTNNNK